MEQATDLPILGRAVARGEVAVVQGDAVARTPKTVDGSISDWTGRSSLLGGTVAYSGGELVYQDHLFDAHGPDDGRDRARFEDTDPIEEVLPEAYRIDALMQADPSGELGIPVPEEYHYDDTYGDAGHQEHADLLEVRLAPQDGSAALLARTTTMLDSSPATALLVLVDSVPDSGGGTIPFDSGIASSVADSAFLLTGDHGYVADVATGAISALAPGTVATSPSGYDNAIEALLPFALADGTRVAIASGTATDAGDALAPLPLEMSDPLANLANVAFRIEEPPRVWFEREQALALNAGSIDPFFVEIDDARLAGDEVLVPGPGYHDRIFVSSENVARESGRNGLYQHYGVFLPSSYDGTPTPLQWWLHWRGGNAHTAAGVVPRVFKHYGEDMDTIVVSPSGRGTGRWYVGIGHVDFLDVWADVHDMLAIDPQRVYLSGHSMGGWGTYLLSILYPDRFAAGAPAAGPVTQGAWTGLDFEGCDEMSYEVDGDEYTPCYLEANGSDPRAQHTRRLLENTLHVPLAIMHGTDDELVPYSGVARQAERLQQLGHRYRFYTYPGYEHYSHPIMDQWAEQARYMHQFAAPTAPKRVTYVRDMPFERATETVQSDGVPLDFDFDGAYWVSHLQAADETNGAASFDGSSLAIVEQAIQPVPDTSTPASIGSTGPFVVVGQQWFGAPGLSLPTASNAFTATLTGARSVQLDLAEMTIDLSQTVTGTVETDGTLELRLDGDWSSVPEVTVDGSPAVVTLTDGVAVVEVPSGEHEISITPPAAAIALGPSPL